MPMSDLLKVPRQSRLFKLSGCYIVGTLQNYAVVKCKWLKCHFAVKSRNVSPYILPKFFNYVVIFDVAIGAVFDIILLLLLLPLLYYYST